MIRGNRGVTLIEILAAAMIGAVLASGSLVAFMLSVKITRESIQMADAMDYAVESMERLRLRNECGDPWFDAACIIQLQSAINDPFLLPPESSLTGTSPDRNYTVTPFNCDGVPGTDCAEVIIEMNWTSSS